MAKPDLTIEELGCVYALRAHTVRGQQLLDQHTAFATRDELFPDVAIVEELPDISGLTVWRIYRREQ